MRTGLQLRATRQAGIALCTTALLAALPAAADEPKGSLTISRELPGRNAFRPDVPGRATTVATAREDVVVAGTSLVTKHVNVMALPDSALGVIGARSGVAGGAYPLGEGTGSVGIAQAGAIGGAMAGATSVTSGWMARATQGGVASGTRALSSIGSTISSVLGGGAVK